MRGSAHRVRRGILVAFAGLFLASSSAFADRMPGKIGFETHVIDHFEIANPARDRFGDLVFRGGLEVESASRAVGGLSGLLVSDGGGLISAITDDALLLQAEIVRDDDGRPVGLREGRFTPLLDELGEPYRSKHGADTEALDVVMRDGKLLAAVSMEGRPRVVVGPVEADGFVGRTTGIALPPAILALRATKGLEALALGRPSGPFDGKMIVLSERPPRTSKVPHRPGWILDADGSGDKFLVGDDGFDITDAKFGPADDLFVLQRSFTIGSGVRARVRRIAAAELVPGALVQGEIVFDATLAHQIDNMEGLALWTDPETGGTVVSMISDDNRSFLQRTLYLEFDLVERGR